MSTSQQQMGELIVNSLRISADSFITLLIEHNEELVLSEEQLKEISNIANANCATQTDKALEQLLRYYG